MGFFKRFFALIKEIFRIIVKISAPIVGVAVALPVSTFFFILYLGVETANLSAAQFNKLLGVGAATLFKNPTLNAMSEFILGIVKGVWEDYALGLPLKLLRTGFKETEGAFADKGFEKRDEKVTGFSHDLQKGTKLSDAAYKKNMENNKKPDSKQNSNPATSPSTNKAATLDGSLANNNAKPANPRSLL